jgi:RNA polymerase sigma-70 factor (ECF subfamily)
VTDAELLTAVAGGDEAALRTLYDRHAPWLTLRLAGRCASPQLVDEALQDTFLAVWRTAGAYAARGEVGAWLWGIAIRRLIDRTRGERRRRRAPAADDVVASAEEQVLGGIEYGALACALATLSPELRAVVQATVLDGLTTREAGHLLGIPSGTVKTRMARAKRQLREALA